MKPRSLQFKVPLRGIRIGPCITGEAWRVDPDGKIEAAHVHDRECPPVGWICARSRVDLVRFLIHELAHLSSDHGHDDRWRAHVRALGGHVTAAYRKRPKR